MVDGVYDKDPHKYADAVRYDTLTFTRVLDERLAVMDSTAATLCRDNGLPIRVRPLASPRTLPKPARARWSAPWSKSKTRKLRKFHIFPYTTFKNKENHL